MRKIEGKRNAELGGKCSKLEHGKRLEESVNEGLRAENLRLHDELQRERSQIQRDTEARKREEDNKMQSRNKAIRNDLNEIASLRETILEKNKEINNFRDSLELKEGEIAKMELDYTKEMNTMFKSLADAFDKKVANMAINHHDKIRIKLNEIRDLEERLSVSESVLNETKKNHLEKLQKLQEDAKDCHSEILNEERLDEKPDEKSNFLNQETRFRSIMEDLRNEMKSDNELERNNIMVNELKKKHSQRESEFKILMDEAKNHIRMLSMKNTQQEITAADELKLKMAKFETELTEACNEEKLIGNHKFWMKEDKKEAEKSLGILKHNTIAGITLKQKFIELQN